MTLSRRRPAHVSAVPFITAALMVIAVMLGGCAGSQQASAPPPAPAGEPAAPPPPAAAMKLRIANLDVSGFRGRIGMKQVEELSRLLGANKIDLLAVQGITRYPSVKTRTDLVEELASATGMRQAFGETINLSGRQSGNALFSAYPITSNDALPFEGVSGSNFEGALRVIVDAGTRPIEVLSTRLPDPLSGSDERICTGVIAGAASDRGKDPLVVLGNLPPPPAGETWREVAAGGRSAGAIWYTPGPISVSGGTTARCELGILLIADVDIFPQDRR